MSMSQSLARCAVFGRHLRGARKPLGRGAAGEDSARIRPRAPLTITRACYRPPGLTS